MNRPADVVPWPAGLKKRQEINGQLDGARNVTLQKLIGLPRSTFSKDCDEPTNKDFINLLATEDVGPFRVRGLSLAVDSLRTILAEVQATNADLYSRLGNAGMLCCRWVRGSTSVISNHSWGTAIDMTIDGKLDPRGDNQVQKGLLDLFPFFHKHGWFWGAAFPTEDAMHFEVSDQLIRRWAAEGRLQVLSMPLGITVGDRGPKVEALQNALNARLGLSINADGLFGPLTRAALIQFQQAEGLRSDGVADPRTLSALGFA